MVKVSKSVSGYEMPCSVYLHKYLHEILNDLDELRRKDFDGVCLITGEEGSGKTTLAMQIALYMDTKFSNDNIVFNAEQFQKAIDTLPKGSVILWDEADDIGGHWASEITQSVTKALKRIRKKNFIILLVTPTFHDLGKYFVMHRTRFTINVYTDFTKRGFYAFFNRDQQRKLYILGKKLMDMKAYRPEFYGDFSNYPSGFPVDLEAYERAKDEATRQVFESNSRKVDVRKEVYANLTAWLDANRIAYERKDLAEVLGVSKRTISRYKNEGWA